MLRLEDAPTYPPADNERSLKTSTNDSELDGLGAGLLLSTRDSSMLSVRDLFGGINDSAVGADVDIAVIGRGIS
jgi:hypothetical protein